MSYDNVFSPVFKVPGLSLVKQGKAFLDEFITDNSGSMKRGWTLFDKRKERVVELFRFHRLVSTFEQKVDYNTGVLLIFDFKIIESIKIDVSHLQWNPA